MVIGIHELYHFPNLPVNPSPEDHMAQIAGNETNKEIKITKLRLNVLKYSLNIHSA